MYRYGATVNGVEQQFQMAELARHGRLSGSGLTQLARITAEHTVVPLGSAEMQLSQSPAEQITFDASGLPLSAETPTMLLAAEL